MKTPRLFPVLLAGFVVARAAAAEKPYTTWSDYAGSPDSMQYSALAQVNKTNVKDLQPAWFYPITGPAQRVVFNPLIVDGVMYVLIDRGIAALDAATGKELWVHTDSGTPSARGITYWESKDRSDRRLVFTARGALREVNAKTDFTAR